MHILSGMAVTISLKKPCICLLRVAGGVVGILFKRTMSISYDVFF